MGLSHPSQSSGGTEKKPLTLEGVFQRVTTFRQEKCQKTEESYFEVILSGVSSFRNQLFDLEKVRRYLQQVAPVPFDRERFTYAPLIDEFLSARLSGYGQYNISLNGKPILKPYRDTVSVSKGTGDHIDGIEFFEIENGKERPFAFGWYGQRRELLGAIARGDDSSGVRVRVGNIQIGDAHFLDSCYREPRFNSYVAGEVHVDCRELIPNSRRDDFVDNMKKGLFYNLIEKKIGLPISKEIRSRSRMASNRQVSPQPEMRDTPENGFSNQQSPNCVESVFCHSLAGPEENAQRLDLISGDGIGESILGNSQINPARAAIAELLKSVCSECPNLSKLLHALQVGKS
jgi:molecular chaperone HtpG